MNLNFLVIFVIVTWDFKYVSSINQNDKKYCSTEACKKTAIFISTNMDKKSNPCNNFYRFACGNFHKNIPTSLQYEKLINFETLFKRFFINHTDTYIAKDQVPDSEPEAFRKMRLFYKECVKSGDYITDNNYRDLLREFGGWPVLDGQSWNESNFSLDKMLIQLRKMDLMIDYLIRIVLFPDEGKAMRPIILKGSLGLIGLVDPNERDLRIYHDRILSFAVTLGANDTEAYYEIAQIVAFERQLYQINLLGPNETYEYLRVRDLQTKYPFISWLDYLNDPIQSSSDFKIHKNTVIAIGAPYYLEKLNDLVNQTSKRTLANYLLWRLINEYDVNMFGTFTCAKVTRDKFRYAAVALLARSFSKTSSYLNVETILVKLHRTLLDMIADAQWMDIRAKGGAEEKMFTMRARLPEEKDLFDDDALNNQYAGLDIVENNYFRTLLNFNAYVQRMDLDNFVEPKRSFDWAEPDDSFEPYFDYVSNYLNVRESFLNPLMYSDERPQYLNYGFLGVKLAYEMSRTFYRDGLFIDTDGRTMSWYNYDTTLAFEKKVNCLIKQFNKYRIRKTNLYVNGTGTLNVNIADNIGINAAYKTYNKLFLTNGEESVLPGLEEYNSKQMFWIAFANSYCEKIDKKYFFDNKLYNTVPPAEHRVRGSVMNIPEFLQDFKCHDKIKVKMNSTKRCVIW